MITAVGEGKKGEDGELVGVWLTWLVLVVEGDGDIEAAATALDSTMAAMLCFSHNQKQMAIDTSRPKHTTVEGRLVGIFISWGFVIVAHNFIN